METRWASMMAVLCIVGGLGCAKNEASTAPKTVTAQSVGPGAADVLLVTTATVEDVDQQTRVVTLRTAEGEIVHFHADEDVRNLPQVRKGDRVHVTYYESLVLGLRDAEGEKPSVSVAEGIERAPLGQKPAGMVVRTTKLTAMVKAVDRTKQTVTLEGPQGGKVTLKVADAESLERAKVGRLVEATYREAVSIKVRAPK